MFKFGQMIINVLEVPRLGKGWKTLVWKLVKKYEKHNFSIFKADIFSKKKLLFKI